MCMHHLAGQRFLDVLVALLLLEWTMADPLHVQLLRGLLSRFRLTKLDDSTAWAPLLLPCA